MSDKTLPKHDYYPMIDSRIYKQILQQISQTHQKDLCSLKTLKGISFYIETRENLTNQEKQMRMEASTLIRKLSGEVKLSYDERVCHYQVKFNNPYFENNENNCIDDIFWMKKHQINKQHARIFKEFDKLCKEQSIKLKQQDQSIINQEKNRFTEEELKFGNVISLNDFIDSLLFIYSNYPEFHFDRKHTLLLHENQIQPQCYDSKSHFVLTKINSVPQTADKFIIRDMHPIDRQVFHQFEQKKQSASIIDSSSQITEQQLVLDSYDYHKLHLDSPPEICMVCTDEELQYFKKYEDKIRKSRNKYLQQEVDLCFSNLNIDENSLEPFFKETDNKKLQMQSEQKQQFEPIPNHAHMYCGICNIKYKDYIIHKESDEHKLNTKCQYYYLDLIDKEINGLNTKQSNLQHQEKEKQQTQVSQYNVFDQNSCELSQKYQITDLQIIPEKNEDVVEKISLKNTKFSFENVVFPQKSSQQQINSQLVSKNDELFNKQPKSIRKSTLLKYSQSQGKSPNSFLRNLDKSSNQIQQLVSSNQNFPKRIFQDQSANDLQRASTQSTFIQQQLHLIVFQYR